jgi:hypothetical protein
VRFSSADPTSYPAPFRCPGFPAFRREVACLSHLKGMNYETRNN